MKTKRLLTTVIISVMMVGAAYAQDALKSYSFIEAQGGVQFTSTNAPIDKLLNPTASLSFGHYFYPAVGLRLHVNGWESKSGYTSIDQYYKWNYITTDADLLLNLTNLFAKKHSGAHPLNVILIGGFGLTNAWGNDEVHDLMAAYNVDRPLVWDDNRLSHNIRAGLRLETNVTKPVGISLEVNANSLYDRFNSKLNNSDDWMFTAQLGLSFRFGHKYKQCCKKVEEPVVVEQPVVIEQPVIVEQPVEPVTEPQPVYVEEKETLHEEIFYVICESDPAVGEAQMRKVADFMKRNPNAKLTLVGYADKGTGNAELNWGYAQQRAERCYKELVENYGCDGSRITVDYKGDTVQPFAENDKNRCVIIDGTGSHQRRVK